jgi:hypothetical protein
MSIYSPTETNWNSTKKHSLISNGEYSSPTKRSRPSVSFLNKKYIYFECIFKEEAYSPSQLDPATMDEVSDQLKGLNDPSTTIPPPPATYVPPSSLNIHQQDVDYREKKKSK